MSSLRDWSVKTKLSLPVGVSTAGLAILPPALFLVEPGMAAHRAAYAQEAGDRIAALVHTDSLADLYRTRRDYWQAHATDSIALRIYRAELVPAADSFFASYDRDFAPAVRRGDLGRARVVLEGSLMASYQRNDAAVERLSARETEALGILQGRAKVADRARRSGR